MLCSWTAEASVERVTGYLEKREESTVDTSLVVLYLGCFYFLSHFFSWVFRRSRFPDVLLLILLGLLLGPALLGIASPEDFGKVGPVMTTVALTVILFQSGTDLKLQKIRDAAGPTLAIGLMTFFMTIMVTTGIALAYGLLRAFSQCGTQARFLFAFEDREGADGGAGASRRSRVFTSCRLLSRKCACSIK